MKEPLHGARFLLSETAEARLPPSEAEVAFVGRSNVGKSSLLCALTNNWKLARVSKTPGATRAINVFEARRGRWLVDLPGYGYAVGPARTREYWPEMIGAYLAERKSLKRTYLLVDAEVGVRPLDLSLARWLEERSVPVRVVGTKTDKIGRPTHAERRAAIAAAFGLEAADVLWATADKGFGIESVRADVIRELGL